MTQIKSRNQLAIEGLKGAMMTSKGFKIGHANGLFFLYLFDGRWLIEPKNFTFIEISVFERIFNQW